MNNPKLLNLFSTVLIFIAFASVAKSQNEPSFTQGGGTYNVNLHYPDKLDDDPNHYKDWLPLILQFIGFGIVFFTSHRQIKNAEQNLLKTIRKEKAKDLIKDISDLVEEIGTKQSLPNTKVLFQAGEPISSKHLLLETKILLQLEPSNPIQQELIDKLKEYSSQKGNIKIADWKEGIVTLSTKVIQTI